MPVFSGTDVDLLRFLSDVQTLADAARLPDAEIIRWSIYYANEVDSELWASLPEANGDDWVRFRSAVVGLYPTVSEDRRYALPDLFFLSAERSKAPIKSKAELGEFHRAFLRISNFLFKRGRLGDLNCPQRS